MTEHEELFRTIAADLEVRTPETFHHREFGAFTPPRDLESTSARPLLVPLCRTVYLVYHSGDRPSARLFLSGGHAARAVHELEDVTYAARLDHAAAGYGVWTAGWTVVERRGADAVVSQDGLTLLARPHEVAVRAPRVGQVVDIRLPTERPYRVPGWYCVVGEAGKPDSSDLIRVYFCLGSAEVAPVLLASVLAELNGHRVAFEAKTVNSPASLVRRDSFVVYLERDQWDRHRHFFTELHRTHEADLRDDYPRFALRLGKGFSFAQDPDIDEGTMSFGEHRSLLVAEGLLDAFEGGALTERERFEAISARYEAAGLDVRAPYLNRERTW
ncbi:T3SS effector HopA1 family protein [Streptomyces sp. S.PNR 29]|uniref:T3SS effector HopA1 family protein n=1 Tax=Streptomyces sp. S.PNR 29 TaxID=2973805 RepID=UPI0025AF117A|nr:T3SS effector HopA1 family protein [Streptomyces sp. S.PNR 29]MDN0195305.1 T3SS effector HopA1 family protein [Streptomyces sp. S.PNR 29]